MPIIIGITKLSLTAAASEQLSHKAYSTVQSWLDSYNPRECLDHCIAKDREDGVKQLARRLRKDLSHGWVWRSGGSPDNLQFEVSWVEVRDGFFCPVTRLTSGDKYKLSDFPETV